MLRHTRCSFKFCNLLNSSLTQLYEMFSTLARASHSFCLCFLSPNFSSFLSPHSVLSYLSLQATVSLCQHVLLQTICLECSPCLTSIQFTDKAHGLASVVTLREYLFACNRPRMELLGLINFAGPFVDAARIPGS